MAFGALRAAAAKRGDYVPLYVAIGAIGLTVAFGAHTIRQQIAYAPAVNLKKSRRETVPEVEDPDRVAQESDKFVKKSFFRKLAHVQQKEQRAADDAVRGDVLSDSRQPRVESLKTVGIGS